MTPGKVLTVTGINTPEKAKTFQAIDFWYRLGDAKKAVGKLNSFVARNGIFFPVALKMKLVQASELLRSALISKEIGHEGRDFAMQREGWNKLTDEFEPMYKALEQEIQSRLMSHSKPAMPPEDPARATSAA